MWNRVYSVSSNLLRDVEKSKIFLEKLKTQLIKNRFLESEEAFSAISKGIRTDIFNSRLLFDGIKSITQMYNSMISGDSHVMEKVLMTFKDVANMAESISTGNRNPVKIAVTGASGNIAYSLLFRIASGQLLGSNVPIILHLLEIPQSQESMKGVCMELQDSAFPLLADVKLFDNAEYAFEGVDYAIMVGARPRSKGMERKDLISVNTRIFSEQGDALNKRAKKTCKILVVGNPANTNCFVVASKAPSIPRENFSSMTRLDHNRGVAQLAQKANVSISNIDGFSIWGNHSSTQYPSVENAYISNRPIAEVIKDSNWFSEYFIPTVQNRGMAVIEARGSSSAASAANAIIDHIRDWTYGTFGKTTSASVASNGEYGITEGLFFSYPVIVSEGKFNIVKNLELGPESRRYIDATHKELLEEREMATAII